MKILSLAGSSVAIWPHSRHSSKLVEELLEYKEIPLDIVCFAVAFSLCVYPIDIVHAAIASSVCAY